MPNVALPPSGWIIGTPAAGKKIGRHEGALK
jgi:hypothetical protein